MYLKCYSCYRMIHFSFQFFVSSYYVFTLRTLKSHIRKNCWFTIHSCFMFCLHSKVTDWNNNDANL